MPNSKFLDSLIEMEVEETEPAEEVVGEPAKMSTFMESLIDIEGGDEPVIEPPPAEPEPKSWFNLSTEEFYRASAGSQVGIWSPAMSARMGIQGFGPRPEGGWSELGVPLGKDGEPYVGYKEREDAVRDIAAEMFTNFETIAKDPAGSVMGAIDFALSVPGTIVGLFNAAGKIGKEVVDQIAYDEPGFVPDLIGTPILDLDKMYTAASEGMKEAVEFFDPTKKKFVGEPTEAGHLVSQIAMVPLTVPSALAYKLSELNTFKDNPNTRGILKFVGDGIGFLAMGIVIGAARGKVDVGVGRSKSAEVAKEMETIAKEAEKIVEQEVKIESAPVSEIIKNAQRAVLEAEKNQLELKAEGIAEGISKDAVVRHDILRMEEDIARAKMFDKSRRAKEAKDRREAKKVEKGKISREKKVEKEKVTKEKVKAKVISITDKLHKRQLDELTQRMEGSPSDPGRIRKPNIVRLKSLLDKDVELLSDLKNDKIPNIKKIEAAKKRIDNTADTLNKSLDEYYKNREEQLRIDAESDPQLALKSKRILEQENIEITTPGKYKDEINVDKLVKKRIDLIRKMELTEDYDLADTYLKHLAMVEARLAELKPKVVKDIKPTTEVDRATGTSIPELEGTNSPLFQTKKVATMRGKLYSELKNVEENVETHTQKLINDANRWYHGDESIDIDVVRNKLSDLVNKSEMYNREFSTTVDHQLWTDLANEAAIWARGIDRLKIEQTKTKRRGTKLHIGVDPTEARRLFKGWHGTSSKYIRPEKMVGDYLKPKSMKQIVEDVLDELNLSKQERENARQQIYSDEYFDYSIKKGDLSRPFEDKRLYIAKDFQTASEYAEWSGEAYDAALIALGAFDKVPSGLALKAKNIFDRNREADPYVLEVKVEGELKPGDNVRDVPVEVTGVFDKKGTKLYTMIPLDEMPKVVSNMFKGVKDVKFSKLFRNKEIFDKTGFWLGKDGKWRFEIDGSKAIINEFILPKLKSNKQQYLEGLITKEEFHRGAWVGKVGDVLNYPELYKHTPEIKDMNLTIFPKGSGGSYSPIGDQITLKGFSKKKLFHEVQHAVSDKAGSKFRGTNVEAQKIIIVGKVLREIKRDITDPELIKRVDKIIETSNKVDSNRTMVMKALMDLASKRWGKDGSVIEKAVNELLVKEPYKEYLKDPGEIEARLTERRLKMSAEERVKESPWETLDEMMVEENLIDEVKFTDPGMKLYAGIPWHKFKRLAKGKKKDEVVVDKSKLTKKELETFELGEEWYKAFKESREAKNFDMARFLDRAHIHTYRAIHEKRGLLRNDLIRRYGKKGHKLVQLIDAEKASLGRAGRLVWEMEKEAFEGVPRRLRDAVDAVNLVERLRDIYGYKTTKQFKPPKGMGPKQNEVFAYLLEIFERLNPEDMAKAKKASDVMFDHVKMWVDEMLEVDLISAEEAIDLKTHNYRKVRRLTVEDIYDRRYKEGIKLGDKLVKQTDSGIDPLGERAIELMETDTKILYGETADRIAKRVDNQRVKLDFVEMDRLHPDNPYVIVKNNDRIFGKMVDDMVKSGVRTKKEAEALKALRPKRKVPDGWVVDYWYDKGKMRTMHYHPDVALQMLSTSPHMSFQLTRFLTNFMGVNLTRALAVGTSGAWALTRGLTMDVLHTFFSARVFDEAKWEASGGKRPWKRLNSWFGPKYLKDMGTDMGEVVHDVFTRGPKTGAYMKGGGHMPFLTMRERTIIGRGIKTPNKWDKFMDGASFNAQSLELVNRVAVMNRVLKNMADERGITLDEAYKGVDLVREAVNVSVERLPYGQGGWLVKEIDKIAGPFISASYNAAKTFGRGAKENPVDFAARIANIGIPTVGLTIAGLLYATKAYMDIPEHVHTRSVPIMIDTDVLKFTDENGDERYVYVKVPVDPMVAAVYNIFRGLTHKALYELGMTEIEPNYKAITDAIATTLPADTPLSPTLSAWLAYFRDIIVWQDRKVVPEKFDWPDSGKEGKFDTRVPQMAKDVSALTDVSGPRIAAATKQMISPNNEYMFILGKLYDAVRDDTDPRLKRQHWAINVSKWPGVKNLIGVTEPRAYRTVDRIKLRKDTSLERMLRNDELDFLAEGFYWKGVGSEKDIDDHIDKFEEEHIKDALERKKNFVEDMASVPNRKSWSKMFSDTPENKAIDFFKIWKASSNEDKIDLNMEFEKVLDAGYLSDDGMDRFYEMLDSLKAEHWFGDKK